MRIVIIAAKYAPYVYGGAERSTQALAEGLYTGGDEVHLITTSPAPTPVTTLNGVLVHSVSLANIYWDSPARQRRSLLKRLAWHLGDIANPIMQSRVRRLLQDLQPDVVHTNVLTGFSIAAWIAAHQLRFPLVHTIRDFYLLCIKCTMVRGQENCQRQCASCIVTTFPRRLASSYVNAVAGVSRYMLDTHIKAGYFSRAKHREAILNVCPQSDIPKYDRPLQSGPITFGYIGRLHPTKGVELLINACKSLPRDGWRLIIAGTGATNYEEHLRSVAAGFPVTFLGEVTQAQFYPLVDLVVVPSLWNDPQPRTVLESFSFGRAVLASRRGGVPEVIKDAQNGMLFEPDSEGELTNRLLLTLEQPALLSALATGAADSAYLVDTGRITNLYRQLYRDAAASVNVGTGKVHE